jgi:hypothetical protein
VVYPNKRERPLAPSEAKVNIKVRKLSDLEFSNSLHMEVIVDIQEKKNEFVVKNSCDSHMFYITAAWLPGPVIGGKIIDSSCLIWNTARTSSKYCAHYNIEAQRFRMHGLMIGIDIRGLFYFLHKIV